jgi:hypothetical protein
MSEITTYKLSVRRGRNLRGSLGPTPSSTPQHVGFLEHSLSYRNQDRHGDGRLWEGPTLKRSSQLPFLLSGANLHTSKRQEPWHYHAAVAPTRPAFWGSAERRYLWEHNYPSPHPSRLRYTVRRPLASDPCERMDALSWQSGQSGAMTGLGPNRLETELHIHVRVRELNSEAAHL